MNSKSKVAEEWRKIRYFFMSIDVMCRYRQEERDIANPILHMFGAS